MPLPKNIEPMLCKIGEPFSSDKHLFEIKWDGTRAITYSDGDIRMLNRRQRPMRERYPDLDFLEALPDGVVLDGEIVVMHDGRPDFQALLAREQARTERRAEALAREHPATYVVFDLLYDDYECLFERPLVERRALLEDVVANLEHPFFVLSDGIIGEGEEFFAAACAQELEGIVAKRLQGKYLAGQRTDSWQKIKRSQTILCLILGYVEAGPEDLRSLIIAAEDDGELRCVGKVGSGLTDHTRKKLWKTLSSRQRSAPLIPCRHAGHWVEPGMYCQVKYLERTKGGELRAPVFQGLVSDEG